MRKRFGSGPAAQPLFEADVKLPHPMLEHPRMIRSGQTETAPQTIERTA